MQWSGHSFWATLMDGSWGWTSVPDSKGLLLGCWEAKVRELAGCQSWVAILRAKGRVSRWLMMGARERPVGMPREPD